MFWLMVGGGWLRVRHGREKSGKSDSDYGNLLRGRVWIFSLFSVLEYYELVVCILNWADAVVWLLLER